jgi:NTE family protein
MDEKIGLGLSGGGFRATLYNLGSLIRLNEMGVLSRLSRITSVSGGSITSAVLAKYWNNLNFEHGVATNFEKEITQRIWEFCSDDFDVKTVFSGLFSFKHSISDKVALKYDKRLFKGTTLGDLKENRNAPQFLFYGTSLQTRSAVRMVDGLFYDWRIGAVEIDDWTLGRIVGISSAFPPVLAPVKIEMGYRDWEEGEYAKFFTDIHYKKRLLLADGGVYDNMGMEALWKKSSEKLKDPEHPYNKILIDDMDYCLISDAGGPTPAEAKPKSNWASILMRTLDQTIEQSRSVRKRWLMDKLITKQLKGCYWGITTKIAHYHVDSLLEDSKQTRKLAQVPTRLTSFDDKTKSQLINWGYALTDAAVKKHSSNLMFTASDARLPYNIR